jgi:hypothetical protein
VRKLPLALPLASWDASVVTTLREVPLPIAVVRSAAQAWEIDPAVTPITSQALAVVHDRVSLRCSSERNSSTYRSRAFAQSRELTIAPRICLP